MIDDTYVGWFGVELLIDFCKNHLVKSSKLLADLITKQVDCLGSKSKLDEENEPIFFS